MSTYVRYHNCEWCGVSFEAHRLDARFCCGAHKAAYDRAYVAGSTYAGHAEKPLEHDHNCEWCGSHFEVNDYAERKGQREAKFCSSRCRVASWRAKTGAAPHPHDQPKQNAERRKGTSQNKGTSQGSAKGTYQQPKNSPPPPEPKRTYNNNPGGSPPPKYSTARRGGMSAHAAWGVIGVGVQCTWETVRKHYKLLAALYHPDTNKEAYATEWMQYVNFAYDVLKVHYGKK